ncbi:MAG TPA: DedA family protein [Saliniramus sp.]|nr:DedA family protein [Saliniramus sp.]
MTEALMLFVSDYGALALFVILAINCLGVPFPTSLIMLAAGSLVEQGEMALLPVLAGSIAGAVVGDQLGYLVGRLGGDRAARPLASRLKAEAAIARAEAFMQKWGGMGVFLTRWLLSPLGPYVNLVAGMTRYSWPSFSFWDLLGESLWVVGYVMLGVTFSRSVQNLASVLGNFTWFLVFAAATLFLGWKVIGFLRRRQMAAGAE